MPATPTSTRADALRRMAAPGSGASESERATALRELSRMGAPVIPPAPRPMPKPFIPPQRSRARAIYENRRLNAAWLAHFGEPLRPRGASHILNHSRLTIDEVIEVVRGIRADEDPERRFNLVMVAALLGDKNVNFRS